MPAEHTTCSSSLYSLIPFVLVLLVVVVCLARRDNNNKYKNGLPIKQKILIDTDPGIDDAMAIHLAFCHPNLEVIGLTTVFGNVEMKRAIKPSPPDSRGSKVTLCAPLLNRSEYTSHLWTCVPLIA